MKNIKSSMNKKFFVLFASCCLISSCFLTQEQADFEINFYDVQFLRNSPIVEKILKNDHGFFEVDYTTQDNLSINAIMLDKSNQCEVQATIISCPGFVPGRKEGMTTLYAMLQDQPYNFIFIDSRGHGKSDGELLTFNGIKHYGESQYFDIIGAINFIIDYNKKHNIKSDIIIHGLCSGAFHTIKALHHLKQNNPKHYNCIKGVVVDSGWPAIIDIAETIVSAESTERCKSVPFLQPYLAYLMMTLYNTCFKEQHSKQTPLTEIIHELDQPIFFIHAENDEFTPIHHVYPLIQNAKKCTTWFVKESSHVNNHLKYKDEYTYELQNFIQATL